MTPAVELAHEQRRRPWPQISHTVWPSGSVADVCDRALGIVLAQACVTAWEQAR